MDTSADQDGGSLPPGDRVEDVVHCLCIDLIRSRAASLEVSTRQYRLFAQEFVDYLAPHVEGVGLSASVVKFTGDG